MDSLIEDALKDLFSQLTEPLQTTVTSKERRDAIADEIQTGGFTDLLLPQEAAGAGITLFEAIPLLKLEGFYNLPVPFAQTAVTRAWEHRHNIALPEGMTAYAAVASKPDTQRHSVTVHKAWYGDWAHMLIVKGNDCYLARSGTGQVQHQYEGNLFAALSWPEQSLEHLEVSPQATAELSRLCLFSMAATIVGAMEKTFEMTVEYAGERKQFGRSVSKFQAVQHQISEMAEHVCAAGMALQLAGDTGSTTLAAPAAEPLAIAQYQIAHIADRVADIAHAVHGAIGISQDYPLHHYTRRIRECKSCYGSSHYWAALIGDRILNGHQDTLLSALTQAQAGRQQHQ